MVGDMKRVYEPYYRLIDHTADLGMEVFGRDAPSLFSNAARALFDLLIPSKGVHGAPLHQVDLTVDGDDWADLMVNWLRELLYLWNGKQCCVANLSIGALDRNRLHAAVQVFNYPDDGPPPENEIKAVTYHQIAVGQENDGWYARVIFDV